MSSEHATDIERDERSTASEQMTKFGVTVTRRKIILGASLMALLVVAVRSTFRLLSNVPFDPVVSPTIRTVAATAMPVTVGVALGVIALTDNRPTVRVGLLFAGVFGLLGIVSPAATLPAVVSVAGGATVAVIGTLGRPNKLSYYSVRRRLIAAGFVAAIAISLANSTGIVQGMHDIGSLLTLSALAAVGTHAERSRLNVVAGLLAAVLVVYASTVSPFVVGSALLVVFAVTGVPHVFFALAVAGGTAAATAGLSRRAYPLAIGASLLVLAGVPVTLPRAMTVILGVTLITFEWDIPAEVTA